MPAHWTVAATISTLVMFVKHCRTKCEVHWFLFPRSRRGLLHPWSASPDSYPQQDNIYGLTAVVWICPINICIKAVGTCQSLLANSPNCPSYYRLNRCSIRAPISLNWKRISLAAVGCDLHSDLSPKGAVWDVEMGFYLTDEIIGPLR